MVQETNRDFKGVWIPKEVWFDTRLNALDKIILVEIDSLDKGDEGCWASNQYLAEFCQCSEKKVSNSISLLIKLGYLYVLSFDGRIRRLKSRLSEYNLQSCLANIAEQTRKNCEADSSKIGITNTTNNTNIKNKDNNILPDSDDEIQERLRQVLENQGTVSAPPFKAEVAEVVAYLNEKAGTRYRPSSKSTSQHIHARLAEGFTVDDCKAVIDKKCAEWLGTDFAQYLRPVTLFGGKFEAYLNAPAKTRKTYGKTGIEVTVPENDDLKGIL